MAKPKISPPKRVDVAEAAAQVDAPRVKWSMVGLIAAGFVVLWVTALMMVPAIGYWGVGAVGVLTLVAIGFGVYVLRMTNKQREILDLMKGATDAEGRKAAIEALSSGAGKDAMKELARAQLVAQDDPEQALEILKAIDVEKAPAILQDEVRCQISMMYLFQNKAKDAFELAEKIQIDRQPDVRAKAKYAAIVAEAFARNGKADEAKKLLEQYKHDDPQWSNELGAILLRAQVYTYVATKNRGLAKKAAEALVDVDPNMLGPFLMKTARPELQDIAKQALAAKGMMPKAQVKMRMR